MRASPPSPNWPWLASDSTPQSVMRQATTTTEGLTLSASPSAPSPGRPLVRRLVQLYVGLALYGASSALLVEAGLGLEPWGVLHQGLAELTGLTIGVVSIIVGAAGLLLWV